MRYLLIFHLIAFSLCLTRIHGEFTTIAIIGTNDIHGSAFPANLTRMDTN